MWATRPNAVNVEDVELVGAGALKRGFEGVWFPGGSGGLLCARRGGGRDQGEGESERRRGEVETHDAMA